MAKPTVQEDALFTVSLEGIKLSEDQVKRIDQGIKEVVMREIARIDHQGDLLMNRKLELNPRLAGIRLPIYFGMWISTLDIFRRQFMEQLK